MSRWLLGVALCSGLGCSAAFADRAAPVSRPTQALAIAPAKVRAPYDVSIMTEDGDTLETYAKGGRYYVLGDDGDRYIIRVSNPTAERVEAVISVDGLDIIDGENGDLHKRGYVVPAYGELKVEGFRTSTTDVATFRFSSVDDSYAGKKGKARNVGVIAVAIFAEVPPPEPPQIIEPDVDYDGRYTYEDDLAPGAGATSKNESVRGTAHKDSGGRTRTASADKRPAPPPAEEPTTTTGSNGGGYAGATGGDAAGAPARPDYRDYTYDEGEAQIDTDTCCTEKPKTGRAGLGTEFGESRYSAASYTKFVRASQKPIAVAELRYNDAAGLIALGIPVQPIPDEGEIMTRETADPFPGDGRFASPP